MKKIFVGFLAVCAVTAAAWGGMTYMKQGESVSENTPLTPSQSGPGPVPPPPPPPTQAPVGVATSPVTATAFKNGTYTVEGNYTSPEGKEVVGITLTVAGDAITAASAEAKATHPVSKKFQDKFVADFAAQIVGKKLSEVTLEKVSGSSLTPKGFNDAVLKIKAEAKAS